MICALKLFTLVIARSSFGIEFQSVGAASIKALSPNVVVDRTAGIESKVIPGELRLYKAVCLYPDLNRKPMQTTKKS